MASKFRGVLKNFSKNHSTYWLFKLFIQVNQICFSATSGSTIAFQSLLVDNISANMSPTVSENVLIRDSLRIFQKFSQYINARIDWFLKDRYCGSWIDWSLVCNLLKNRPKPSNSVRATVQSISETKLLGRLSKSRHCICISLNNRPADSAYLERKSHHVVGTTTNWHQFTYHSQRLWPGCLVKLNRRDYLVWKIVRGNWIIGSGGDL